MYHVLARCERRRNGESVQLSEWEMVVDVRQCIDTNVQLMEQAGTRALQTPVWDRLQRLYGVLTNANSLRWRTNPFVCPTKPTSVLAFNSPDRYLVCRLFGVHTIVPTRIRRDEKSCLCKGDIASFLVLSYAIQLHASGILVMQTMTSGVGLADLVADDRCWGASSTWGLAI